MTYSAEIAGAVDAFLKAEGLFYSFDEERGMFRFGMQYDGRMQKMDIAVRIRDDYFIVYAIPPLTANGCLPEMAEFIARVNYGLQNGCFEMDYEDGEIRFRTFVDCDGQLPGENVIRNGIYTAVAMMRRYGDGVAAVIFGAQTPVIAAAACVAAPRS